MRRTQTIQALTADTLYLRYEPVGQVAVRVERADLVSAALKQYFEGKALRFGVPSEGVVDIYGISCNFASAGDFNMFVDYLCQVAPEIDTWAAEIDLPEYFDVDLSGIVDGHLEPLFDQCGLDDAETATYNVPGLPTDVKTERVKFL